MEDSLRVKLIEHAKKNLPGIPDAVAAKILDADLSLRRVAHAWMTHTGIKMPKAAKDGLQFEHDYTAKVIGPALEFFIERLGKFVALVPHRQPFPAKTGKPG